MYDRQPAKVYKVIFGSNVFENCPSIVTWEDKDIILRFRDGGDMKLLVECTVKDKDNNTIAKIANNKLQFAAEFLDFRVVDNGIILKDKKSDIIYLEFRQLGEREVKINGLFYVKGNRIEATDGYLYVNTNKLIGNRFINCRTGIGLGPSGFSIG